MKRPTILVVYDDGAARPADIAVGLAEWANCVFVVEPNDHNLTMRPLLTQFGQVVVVDRIDRAVEGLRALEPDGLVTYSERTIVLAARLALELDLPFHSLDLCERLTDKWQQRAALNAANVDVVRCHRVGHLSDWDAAVAETGLPAVLKPAQGGGSRNTFLITDAEEGRRGAAELLALERPGLLAGGTLVLEEYLRGRDCGPFGDYVSVESLVLDGHVHDVAVTGKLPMVPPFRETGRFWPSPLAEEEEDRVRDLARRAVTALGITLGITHTEIKLTPDGPRIIEVNGRLGGGMNYLAERAMGVNLIELAARAALGLPVQVPPFYRGRTHFHIFHSTPRRPGTLLGVDGVNVLKTIPGVTLYRPYVRAGYRFTGEVQTQEIDIVLGAVDDLADLPPIVEKVESTLRYRFAFSTGEIEVNGRELGQL
ncbi:ATP-grasp domain-containing protein [Actinomadura sp. 6K520]|uniref:ATP-binding protein n=1 Tax=Actinomadura sp. 6K520 TaxID=2530364 RepID=UPI00105167D0|nr:ATP-grasp domain-containing protein [Actinomadura sp. 6K520]TDE32832.1 ATP-grasp domain-containing protein [Actinomadura sp. 6K520]